jgi:hypothetical protein
MHISQRSTASTYDALLPAILPAFQGRKCLVLDLDETLVHSSFKVSCRRVLEAIIVTRLFFDFNHRYDDEIIHIAAAGAKR